jgi:hypothetical protein
VRYRSELRGCAPPSLELAHVPEVDRPVLAGGEQAPLAHALRAREGLVVRAPGRAHGAVPPVQDGHEAPGQPDGHPRGGRVAVRPEELRIALLWLILLE